MNKIILHIIYAKQLT